MIAKKEQWNQDGLSIEGKRKISVRCPFHQENTPSCIIDPYLGIFQCFGCGAKGYIGEDGSLFTEESGSFRMNSLTKEDLTEIHRCLKYMIKGGTTPYSDHTISLTRKVKAMVERYCEHKETKMDCDGGISLVCANCGYTVVDA